MTEESRIRTNFLDNQAREISKPGLSKTKKQMILGVILLVLGFGAFQIVNFFINLPKYNAMKCVLVSLDHPGLRDGVALVDVRVENLNPVSISKIKVKYNIIGPSGSVVDSKIVSIPDSVPAGDSRTFPHVKLGQLAEQSARMQAELVDVALGPASGLTADQENKFIDSAALKGEEKQHEFERFVNEAPNFMPGQVELARSYMATNDFDKAITVLRKAIEKDPRYGDAHYNLALALEKQGNREAAGKELRKALDLMPDDPDVQRNAQHFDPE